jgi:predicted GNAT family acetyltransferase
LCRKLAAKGITPIAYITEENSPALKLIESCGFKKLGMAYWFGISSEK